jgi:hypothetical protein
VAPSILGVRARGGTHSANQGAERMWRGRGGAGVRVAQRASGGGAGSRCPCSRVGAGARGGCDGLG